MAIVDWRNRFSANWITSVRSQGAAPNCWAFAMTALYEAMVRIEHGVWCRRSEGDLGRATGKQPWDLGNLGEAQIAAERFGIADPDCLAWSEAAVLYTAKPHGAAMTAMPLSPTPDRAGRTVRVDPGRHQSATTVADKKSWIDLVGPMALMCTLPADFTAAPATGVYSRATANDYGVHAMLVVGFDDSQACWIVKNSWGTAWADGGFVRVAYGQAWLENPAWTGMRNTNPDPWTKRRRRNGVIIESGNGAKHQNLELFLRNGTSIVHDWQEAGSGPWNSAGIVQSTDVWRGFPQDALECPSAVQSTFNRNFDVIYRSTMGSLRHIYFDQASQMWFDATLFGPPNPVLMQGFVQGSRGAPGDYEVAVMTSAGTVEHWTKHNGAPWTQPPGTWRRRAIIATGMGAAGPALVSSRLNLTSELEQERGELHYVCSAVSDLRHFRCAQATASWSQIAAFGSPASLYSGPCMIESLNATGNELDAGNLDVFVETGNRVEHWTRTPPASGGPPPTWQLVATFGADVECVVGALQGSSSVFEVCVQRTDQRYQQYSRPSTTWIAGPIIP
jgi:hypothetical protein